MKKLCIASAALVSACASAELTADQSERCEAAPLEVVAAQVSNIDGTEVCGEYRVYVLSHGAIRIVDIGNVDGRNLNDLAIIPMNRNDEIVSLFEGVNSGDTIRLRGRFDIMKDCFSSPDSDVTEDQVVYGCRPVDRPLGVIVREVKRLSSG